MDPGAFPIDLFWDCSQRPQDGLSQGQGHAVSARPKRNGVMVRIRRQNLASVPQALSNDSENTHWNLSATMLSCP